MSNNQLFANVCFLIVFGIFGVGCYSAGGGHSYNLTTPDETYEDNLTCDSRGQCTRIVDHNIHPRPGMQSTSRFIDPYGGHSGMAHTDVPDGRGVTRVCMTSGPYKGQCFASGGPMPMVRDSVEAGEGGRQEQINRQVILNTAHNQDQDEAINCMRNNNCR